MTRHPTLLTLGFLSPHDPHDRRAFSGSVFFAAKALAERPNVDLRILGHQPPSLMTRLLRRQPSAVDSRSLDLAGLDAVIGMVASPLLDEITGRGVPFLHVTDATPAFLRETYGWAVPGSADETETRVVQNAAMTVYSSSVMAERAAADLGVPDLRADVAPFGVNFDDLPQVPREKPPLSKLNLLFVGIDWERKGGDIAVAAVDLLRGGGHDVTLSVVGRCPERHRDHPAIRSIGFLNKNRPRDRARLSRLYGEAHLLLLPSRGDCTPMVVAEAMAHGTPVLASDTGGIRNQIGQSAGMILSRFDSPANWASAILRMTSDEGRYRFAMDACLDRSQNSLCWSIWAARVEAITRRALAPQLVAVPRDRKVAVSA